jgi:hypothetical protein
MRTNSSDFHIILIFKIDPKHPNTYSKVIDISNHIDWISSIRKLRLYVREIFGFTHFSNSLLTGSDSLTD